MTRPLILWTRVGDGDTDSDGDGDADGDGGVGQKADSGKD